MGVSLWKLLIRLMPIYYQLTPSSDQTLSRFRQAAGQPADDWYAIKHASGRLPGGSRFQVAGGCGGGPAAGSPQRAAAASFFPRRSNEKAPGRRPGRWRRQCCPEPTVGLGYTELATGSCDSCSQAAASVGMDRHRPAGGTWPGPGRRATSARFSAAATRLSASLLILLSAAVASLLILFISSLCSD